MHFLTYFSFLASAFILTSVNAYQPFQARGMDYDGLFARSKYDNIFARGEGLYGLYQRRSNFLSELSTRDLVDELGMRLVRRTLPPDQQLAAVKTKGVALTLVIKKDQADLAEFMKLAKTLSPVTDATPGSPSKQKPPPLAGVSGDKSGKGTPPVSPVHANSNDGKK